MNAKPVPDFHVLTDAMLQTRYTHAELAGLAAAGGATAVQFREKRDWDVDDLIRIGRQVRDAAPDVVLIVNDRVELAAAIGADGVHLGPSDRSVDEARRMLGPEAIIGRTANDLEAARAADDSDADYLGIGPVFGTRSKANPAPELGLDELARIVAVVTKPVIAIGSITVDRVPDVLATGVHGVAVLSGVTCSGDPADAAREVRRVIDACRKTAS